MIADLALDPDPEVAVSALLNRRCPDTARQRAALQPTADGLTQANTLAATMRAVFHTPDDDVVWLARDKDWDEMVRQLPAPG